MDLYCGFKYLLFFLLFTTNYADDKSLKILLFQHGFSPSHLRFSGSLANILSLKKHTVDQVYLAYNPSVRLQNANSFRMVHRVEMDNEENPFLKMSHMTDPFEEQDSSDFLIGKQQEYLKQTVGNFCDILLSNQSLMNIFKKEHYDIMLTSAYTCCPYALAYGLNIRSVVAFTATAGADEIGQLIGIPLPPSFVGSQFMKPIDHKNFFQRTMSFLRFLNIQIFDFFATENDAIRKNLPQAPSPKKLVARLSYLFLNTDEIIDLPRPLSAKIKYIGGIASEIAHTIQPAFIGRKLSDILNLPSEGIIVMSFGSLLKTTHISEVKKLAIIRAFARFPEYTFIWKYDDIEKDARLFVNSTNVYLFKWLPQIPLLRHPRVRVFITHLGQNSYLELSQAGIPAIAIPIFADQLYNTEVAVRKGVAVYVDKTKLNSESLSAAIHEILYNPRYTEKAREIAHMILNKPDRIDANGFTRMIEYAAKFPSLGTDVFQMPSTDLSIIQLYCYDIILSIIVVLVLFLASLIGIFFLFRRLYLFLIVSPKHKIQ